MKLTNLTLQNFKAIGDEPQTIAFKPITLLYGPNSAGKSSILQSLMYLLEILQSGNCNPGTLKRLAERNLGGFFSLVNDHDLYKSIVIRIGFEYGSSIVSEYSTFAEWVDNGELKLLLKDIAGETRHAEVELTITWSHTLETAYVEAYQVWLNGEFIGSMHASADSKAQEITKLNFAHPLLIPYDYDDWAESEFGEDKSDLEPGDTEFKDRLLALNPNRAVSSSSNAISDDNHDMPPIAFYGFAGALPLLGKPLITNLEGRDVEESRDHFDREIITTALTQVFVSPLDHLEKLLEESIYIGPLREVPSRNFIPNTSPRPERWINGLAAWDMLYRIEEEKLTQVSKWFYDEDKLDAGYEVVRETFRQLPVDSPLYIALSQMREELDDSVWVQEQLETMPEKTRLVFKDLKKGLDLSPEDLGVGISQVLPIVVAALVKRRGLIAVEQPELHIHPSFQVELGSLFIQAARGNEGDGPCFLLETHSEYLMLRFLRRLFDTSEDELAPGEIPLIPKDISVCYVDAGDKSLTLHALRLDDKGEFLDPWPKGFFPERTKELF
ncbi:MAG: AAA family ATPase [Candidatus Thiodiazotropha taylori]|nr:AAA family ATPase [Candidatus Thiodiazotropha taylori]